MSEFFDDLARALAKPMPRSRLVRLVGGLIAASTVPGLKTSGAWAATGRATSSTPDTIDPPDGPWGQPIPCGKTSFGPVVCNPTSNCVKCCPVNGQPGSCCPCYVTCTRAGLCGTQFACPPDGRPYCGGGKNCCLTNETCFRGICLPICKPGETLCDRDCCPRGAECVQFTTPGQTRGGRPICMPKCPGKRTRCGLQCCPRGQKCINSSRSICAQCDSGSQPCGKKCCARGSTCCDPRVGLCCRSSETCAGYGGKAKCCPRGTKACASDDGSTICCKRGEVCAQVGNPNGTVPTSRGGRRTCCPPERTVSFAGGGVFVCCPSGYSAIGGDRLIVTGGMCCRNDKWCGNTCCGTTSSPIDNQTCCNGRCTYLYSDANNCGSCGTRCPAGQRCQGGTCVPA